MRFHLAFCGAFLAGCANQYEARLAALETRNAKLKRDLKNAQKLNAGGATSDKGKAESPPPTAPEGTVALPAILPPGPVIPAYPGQHQGFAYTPPIGWGQSTRSVVIETYLYQEVPGTTTKVDACWLGVEIDNIQVNFAAPSPLPPGAKPLLWNVVEGNTRRTITLLPPGVWGYVLLNKPGIHAWRVRCYDGPPISVEAINNSGTTVTVPALVLIGEMIDRGVNPNRIVVKNGYLNTMVGNLD